MTSECKELHSLQHIAGSIDFALKIIRQLSSHYNKQLFFDTGRIKESAE